MEARERKAMEEETSNQPAPFKSFDDILVYVGDAGRFQWLLFLMLLPFTFTYAFLYFAQYFITLIPEEYWCKVPEFENTNLSDWQKIALSVPPENDRTDGTGHNVPYSRCKMYITNYTEVLITGRKPHPDTPIGACQYGWSFNQTSVPYLSIGAELEWVCDKAYLGTIAQSIFFMGSIVGGFIFGYIADRYGRLTGLIACNTIVIFTFIGTAFTNNFWSFAIVRFIAGTSFDNSFNTISIIVMEYVGPKYRKLVLNLSMGIYFAVAMSILPWIAYWLSNWKILSVTCASPLIIIFVTPWIVPESARWYLQNNRPDKAVEILKKIAKINKKNISEEILIEFEKGCKSMKNETLGKAYTILDLFKSYRLGCIMMALIINWSLIQFIFDALVWNMKTLHSNIFVSFSFSSIAELPAAIIVIILLDKWGRRWMCFLFMLICGAMTFVTLQMPFGTAAMYTATIARVGGLVALNISLQQCTELLPTVVRVQGVSLIHIIGFTAHMLGPNISLLANVEPSLPLILIGSLSFVSAFISLTLPETMDQQLPDTLEEGNNFGKEQSFWLIPCLKKNLNA